MRRNAKPLCLILALQLLLGHAALAAQELNPATIVPKQDRLPPAAVGWGNLLVPGLGATLSDHPLLGLTEAALEIGTFYSGTLLAEEKRFKIDGSVVVPDSGNVGKAMTAEMLQQFGLKYHFYNTFYHYQQAVIADEASGRPDNNPQPIYRGDWKDMLAAPFQWKNVSSIWSWPIILGVGGYLFYDFKHSNVTRRTGSLTGSDFSLYGASELIAVPVGSSFGEDPLFRGFIEREVRGMTGSLWLAILAESIPFALLHSDRPTAFGVGVYFGIEADALKGDLGPMMAAHFWINVVIGLLDYWTLKRSTGRDVPLNPPVSMSIQLPF
jgi:hypothetical protein